MSDDRSLADFMPGAEAEGATAHAGEPLPPGEPVASEEAIVEAIRTVYDPEIPVNIYELGLIYRLERDDKGDVAIDMTLTAPACPVAGEMPGRVAEAVSAVDGVGRVAVHLVWEPPWTKDRMSEDAKLALGVF
ncbi:MAG: SUF system Fe-S cluster assembly protein [Rhodospirillaceae bacterium]|nr:SUF system Fe-S cluster assembly protein [Rhodospirillaceae bacterium]